jgi:epoxyqueuosine reductase
VTSDDPLTQIWSALGEALDGHGWRWRAVAVERLPEASLRVSAALDEIGLTPETADSDGELLHAARAELPPESTDARALVIGALARPVTQATLVVDGVERTVVVPPHYAAYYETPRRFAALVNAVLALHGHAAVEARMPFKTLAAGSGLARYGRNNIAYVDGLGSYLQLAACAVDVPAPADAVWGEARALDACASCVACERACPTGAITGEAFVIRADRCLTMLNEGDDPFPDWVEPGWHTCAVGCLACQKVCPENAGIDLRVEEPVRFDAEESAAIMAGDEAPRDERTAAKLALCGLDYEPGPMARNLHALLDG